jgi:hypothetical protein
MIGKLPVVLLVLLVIMTSAKSGTSRTKGLRMSVSTIRQGRLSMMSHVTVTDDPAYVKRTHNYGTVIPGGYTEYFRFDIAHTEADITVKIGNVTYSTPATQFDYLAYIGPDRITYRMTIMQIR